MTNEKQPTHEHPDIERGIIGHALHEAWREDSPELDGGEMWSIILKECPPESFTDKDCRRVITLCRKMREENPNAPLTRQLIVAEDPDLGKTLTDCMGRETHCNAALAGVGVIAKAWSMRKALKSIGSILTSGMENAEAELMDIAESAWSEAEKLKAFGKPAPTQADRLNAMLERDRNRKGGLFDLGFGANKFTDTFKVIDGLQPGFYLLSADTSVGKTAVLTNFFWDILNANDGLTGIYYSLDDSWEKIAYRLLAIESETITINDVAKFARYAKEGKPPLPAYNKFGKLLDDGRLQIKDLGEVANVNTIRDDIRNLDTDNLFICIDGLYNLPSVSKYGSVRDENITRANAVKALVDTYRIPLIATGELQKNRDKEKAPGLNDLMESGKYAYNANLVWLLHADDPKWADCEPRPDILNMSLRVAKNKLSGFKGVQKLLLNWKRNGLQEVI